MDQILKQRLVGAIVLVSLAVIFIPVILEGPRDEWAPRNHTIPEPPDLAYTAPAELPVPALQPDDVAPATDSAESRDEPQDAPVPAPVAEHAASEPAVTPPPVEKPPVKQAQSLAAGWYVQVGSFSQSGNADRLRDRLRKAGLDTHRQATAGGAGYRVLVGPEKTRELAEKLRHDDSQGFVEAAERAAGYQPLVMVAHEHASNGLTTIEEMLRLAGEVPDDVLDHPPLPEAESAAV